MVRNRTVEWWIGFLILVFVGAMFVWTLLGAVGCAVPMPLAQIAQYAGLDEPEATEPPDGWAWCIVVRRDGRWSLGMYWLGTLTGESETDPRHLAGVRWLEAQGNEIMLSKGQALELMTAASVAVNRGADPNDMPPDPNAGPWDESVMVVGPGLGGDCWRWGLARWIEEPNAVERAPGAPQRVDPQ